MIDAAIVRLLLEASLRVLVVAAAVGLVLWLTRVQKGSVRHTAWTAVVVTMLLMPALVFVVPQFALPQPAKPVRFLPEVSEMPYIGGVDFGRRIGADAGARPAGAGRLTAVAPAAPVVAAVSQPGDSVAPRRGWPLWAAAVVAIYAGGLAMLLIRWIRAARFLARLRRDRRPIVLAGGDVNAVFESPLATTPFTVGAVHPWIVLPAEWRNWSAEKLSAVLAHERSHVRRHDPLIGLVAYVNRCIYWFNPLSWWLERQLATAAEHAADEEGVKAIGQGRDYAQVLLDMAAAVQRHGGRVAWQGVGVDGNGLLGQRIDRVLSRSFLNEVSPMKHRLILGVSILAIVLAVACKRPVDVPPLHPDPKVTADLTAQQAAQDRFGVIREMTVEQADALEAKLRENPDDVASREDLLYFYSARAPYLLSPARIIEARRPHVLWLIEHRPELQPTVAPARLDPVKGVADPTGIARATTLWLDQLKKKDLPVAARQNGIAFLQSVNLTLAERAALDAHVADPSSRRWTQVLAGVYASAITGTRNAQPGLANAKDIGAVDGPDVVRVRAVLDGSTDAALLADTGRGVIRLALFGPQRATESGGRLDVLGRSYIARAIALNASLPDVAGAAAYLRDVDTQRRISGIEREHRDPADRLAVVDALPEAERFPLLAWLAESAYMNGESSDYYRHETDKAKAAWAAAGHFAAELVTLAPKYKDTPDWSSNVFRAHVVLALVALRNGDVPAAVKELKAAPDVPKPLSFQGGGQLNKLANTLLDCGERGTVADFYERVAALQGDAAQGTFYSDAAAAIRAGLMPAFYQRQLEYIQREQAWKAKNAK